MNVFDKIWNWMTAQEPTATVEMMRQVLPFFILIGWIHMTDQQTALFYMAISAFLAWLNRRSVTPNAQVALTMDPRKIPIVVFAVLGLSMWAASCAKSNAPLDAQTAHYAGQVESGVVAVQSGFLTAYKAGQIPFATADPVMGYAKQATEVAADLSAALKIWHAATSPDAQALAAANVRAALDKLETLVAKMAGVKVPDGFLDKSLQLIMAVRDAVAAIRAQFPGQAAPSTASARVISWDGGPVLCFEYGIMVTC